MLFRSLRSIARALQLTDVETRYVLELGLDGSAKTPPDEVATPTLLSVVNGLSSPVLVLGKLWDVITCNAAACALWDIDRAPSRNWLELCFTPQVEAMHPDWAFLSRHKVSLFRACTANVVGHAAFDQLVSRVAQRSPQFRDLWAERQVSHEMYSGHTVIDHPFVGRLCFDFEILCVLESQSLIVEVFGCDGAETRQRVDALMRQQERGEHGPARNLWTALAPRSAAART